MNLLYILGALGGILAGIDVVSCWAERFGIWYRKYQKMKRCYERNKNDGEKPPMGFMTEKEREEIKDRLTAKQRA